MRGRVLAVAAGLLVATGSASAAEAVRVGSKSFTESVVLGEVARGVLEDAGVAARHRRALGGTRLVFNALVAGEIDVYPDYTGTLRNEIFAGRAGDAAALEARLAELDLGITPPLGFRNNYALGMRRERAAALGIERVSELADHPGLVFRFSNEFMDRADGWPALRAAYALPQADVRGVEHDLAYRGLAAGAVDVTELYTTDAEIAYYDLVALADDRRFFPAYEAVFVYRLALARERPGAVAALETLAGRIDAARMIAMNARVKLGGAPESDAAAGFLAAQLGVTMADSAETRWQRLRRFTAEHLVLVGSSLAAAVLVAVPLGIAAARRPRLGQVILGAVGIAQTIPALALLVFMIPLFGIGAAPAVVALFLYSLLPIVRNTHAGLVGIPRSLLESADAMGLPRGARLRLIETPLATPSILAGIKTAAVINVGAATLGALIGAGGYGQPILTGIRLDDTALILEGAVPAALLALAVQWLFERAERLLVPRGLRIATAR